METTKMLRIILCVLILLQAIDCTFWSSRSGGHGHRYGHHHGHGHGHHHGHGHGHGSSSTDCSKKRLTDDHKRRCALKHGRLQLLNNRNSEWGWDDPIEAESVIAIQLSKDDWFSKDNLDSYITVKEMEIVLLSAISKDATLDADQWSRGKLAYYVMALLSVCENPRDFYGYNLVDILDNHLVSSSAYLNTNKFAYALIVLALCKAGQPVDDKYQTEISTTPGVFTFGVDEAAMVYMAYQCVGNQAYRDKQTAAIDYILKQQDNKGVFGNEYSTALALQAIFASGDATLESRTDKGIQFLVTSVDRSKKPFSSLILSVLPALAKKSFLNVGEQCPEEKGTTTATTPTTPVFTVGITVFNNLTSNFDTTWSVSIHDGETLFDTLTTLQDTDTTFSFTSKATTWGQFITSVCNMTASTDDRQYWQLLDSNNKPLDKGASHTLPVSGDSYVINLTTW